MQQGPVIVTFPGLWFILHQRFFMGSSPFTHFTFDVPFLLLLYLKSKLTLHY